MTQPASDGLRVKCLRLSPATFGLAFATDNIIKVIKGLPANSVYAGSGYDEYSDTFLVFFEHDSFDVIAPNGIPEEINVELKDLTHENKA